MSVLADGDSAEAGADERAPDDSLLFAALSALVAGAGQWRAGKRRRGLYYFAPFAVAAPLAITAIVVAFNAARGSTSLLDSFLVDLFVNPTVLWWLLAVNVVLLVVRLASVLDAYRLGQWRSSSATSRVLLVALTVFVIAPHAVVASYNLDAIDVLNTVFVDDEVAPLAQRERELLDAGVREDELGPPLSVITTTSTTEPPTTTAGREAGTTSTTTTTRPPSRDDGSIAGRDPDNDLIGGILSDEPLNEGRLTFLLAGGDAGPGRSGLRTDTMIVATIDLETSKAIMFALPRNLARVPLPPEFNEAFIDLEKIWWEKELAQIASTSTTTTTTRPPTTTTTSTTTTTTTTSSTTATTVPGSSTSTSPTTTTSSTTTTTTQPPTTTTTTQPPPTPTTTTTTTLPPFRTCNCYVDILNSLYGRTQNWVRTFPDAPDPGMEALKRTISNLLGLEIDYYVLVDMKGFVALVDAIGGVDIYFEKEMHIAFSPAEEGGEKAFIKAEPGMNHLTGLEALAYVRNRYRSSDYVRMQRQRCMLRSIAGSADIFTLVRRFSNIAGALTSYARSDIPVGLLPELIRQVSRLDLDDIDTIAFQPGYYAPSRDFGRYPIPDPDRIRRKVQSMLAGESTGSGDGEPVGAECG